MFHLKACVIGGVLCAGLAWSQSGTITTLAGGYPFGDGGSATEAALFQLGAMAVDDSGNLFVVDGTRSLIHRITPDGTIRVVAGNGGRGSSGDGGPATKAEIGFSNWEDPTGLALDRSGNLYYSDFSNHRVRRIGVDGIITTIAGTGSGAFGGDGGPAAQAQLSAPAGLAMDANGNLYVADSGNHRVRKIDSTGVITTVAGTGEKGFAGDGGPAVNAQLASPIDVAIDLNGNLYIAESGTSRVRKVDSGGTISTVAGGGTRSPADGVLATEVSLGSRLTGVAVDPQGNLHLNLTSRVFRLTSDGRLVPAVGSGVIGNTGEGGPAKTASLWNSKGIVFDREGNLHRSDLMGQIRKVDRAGIIRTIAGASYTAGAGGPAAYARVCWPSHLAADTAGNVFMLEQGGFLRKVSTSGILSILGGESSQKPLLQSGQQLPAGSVTLGTSALTTDRDGNLYVLGARPARIYVVTPDGLASIVPGTDSREFFDALGSGADDSIARDSAGNFYISSGVAHRVFRLAPGGAVSVFAGSGTQGFGGDGGPASQAYLNTPGALAVDASGSLFIADDGNYRIRRVDSAGIISTVAGTGRLGFNGDGREGTQTDISRVHQLAADNSGNVYFADQNNQRIRKLTPAGIVITVAGDGNKGFSGDGGPATSAAMSGPWGVTVDANGSVFVADTGNHRVRKVQGSAPFLISPSGLLFATTLGTSPAPQQLTITVAEREERAFRVTVSAAWLSVSLSEGSVPTGSSIAVTVTASAEGLPKGTYVGRITFIRSDGDEQVVVPVTMLISGTPAQLKLSQTALTFVSVVGGGAPPAQSLRVLNTGTGQMNWTVSASTLAGGAGWLTATAPGVDVKVNPAGLAAGTYYGLITVTAPSADNSPQSAVVLLVVLPADQRPGPVVSPLGLIFTSDVAQRVIIANVSTRAVQFTSSASVEGGRNWLAYSPTSGTVVAGGTQVIEIKPNLQTVVAGVYRGEIELRFQPDSVSVRVSLLLVVAPSVGKSAVRAAASCTADRWLPVFRSPGESFTATAGWPQTVEVGVVDNCGQQMNSGQVAVTFSQNDPQLRLVSVGEGRWTGVWASRNPRASGVQLTARAESESPRLVGEARITGGVKDSPEQPAIAPGGVVNAASLRRDAPVAVGGYVSIFGTKLARETSVTGEGAWPLELGDTAALVAGRLLPLQFISEGQVNGVLPQGVADSTRQQMIVRKGQSYSLPEEVLVAASEPGIFTVSGGGSGQASAYVSTEAGLVLADAGTPAKSGELVLLYAAGLGPVDAPVKDGEAGPAEPPAKVTHPVKVTIQGREAEVVDAYLSASLVGVYEVLAKVPGGVKADTAAQVVLSVGDQSASPVVTIAVAGDEVLQ